MYFPSPKSRKRPSGGFARDFRRRTLKARRFLSSDLRECRQYRGVLHTLSSEQFVTSLEPGGQRKMRGWGRTSSFGVLKQADVGRPQSNHSPRTPQE
jgi:hypothetical protein